MVNQKKVSADILQSRGFGDDLLLIFKIIVAGYSFFVDLFVKKRNPIVTGDSNFVIVAGHDALNDCGAPNIVKYSDKGGKNVTAPAYETGAIANAFNFLSAAYYRYTSDSNYSSNSRLFFVSNWEKFKVHSVFKKNTFRALFSDSFSPTSTAFNCLVQVHFDIASTKYENETPAKRVNKHIIYYHSASGKKVADAACSYLSSKNRNVIAVHDSEHRSGRIGFVRDTQDVAILVEFGYVNSTEGVVAKFCNDFVDFLMQYKHT